MNFSRINNYMEKPLSEKLRAVLYNYRSLKARLIIKFRNPQFLLAKLDWGTMKVVPDWLGLNIYFGSYERQEMQLLSRMVKKDWVALDIGANIGYYTLFFCKALHCRQVFAFEPSPREFRLLRENVEMNNCTNLETLNIALGDKDATIKLYLSSNNVGRNSVNFFESSDQEVEVPLKVLDTFTQENNLAAVDFIKMDVEGAEPAVLRGAATTLKKFKPVIQYESWAFTQAPYGKFECETTSLLESNGYRIYDITPAGWLRKINVGDSIKCSNAIAIHSDRETEFRNFVR